MHNSVEKYLDQPVMQEKSHMKLEDIKHPVVYVCEDDQFNYTRANEYGYYNILGFTLGNVSLSNEKMITWKGMHKNNSYFDLKNKFYTNNDSLQVTLPANRVFIPLHGFCLKFTGILSSKIFSQKKAVVFIGDPYKDIKLRTSEMDNAIAYLGPTGMNTYDVAYYDLQYTIYDNKLHDGKTCFHYEKKDSSYAKCIVEALKNSLLRSYGCLPPWISNDSLSCEHHDSVPVKNETFLTETGSLVKNLIYGKDLNVFQTCSKPCISMSVVMKRNLFKHNVLERAEIDFQVREDVVVFTEVITYDEFSLVVDLGSALGLWLGLSALSIFEFLYQMYNFIRSTFMAHVPW